MTEQMIGTPRFRGRVRRPQVLVIGGGLAGMTAALAARRTGARVTLVAEGAGVLELASGCIDRLAVPSDVLPPEHPYRLLGMEAVDRELAVFQEELSRVGWPLSPGVGVITALGARRPTYLVAPGMAAPPPDASVRVVGFRGLRDFDPSVVAAGLGNASWCWVDLPGSPEEIHPVALARLLEDENYRAEVITAVRTALSQSRKAAAPLTGSVSLESGESEFPANGAGALEGSGSQFPASGARAPQKGGSEFPTSGVRASERGGSEPTASGASAPERGAPESPATEAGAPRGADLQPEWVLFPAVLGLAGASRVQQAIAEAIGMPVAEVLLPPPSVPGLRLAEFLRRAVQLAGVDLALNSRAVRAQVKDGRVVAVVCEGPGGRVRYEAEAYVLATGGLLGNGLMADGLQVTEPLFGLPVTTPQPGEPSAWADASFLPEGGHPFVRVGVAVNDELRPEGFANLFVCGRTLAGYDPYAEGSGGGVAVATGGVAGRRAGRLALTDGGERR